MAISPVGGATANSVGVTTLSVNYAPTAGNIVVVGVGTDDNSVSSTGMSVKDSANNLLTAGPTNSPIAGNVGYLFYYTAVSGITSFSASWTNAPGNGCSIIVEEYSGVLGGVNPTGNSAAADTNSASVSLTTTQANSFVAGFLYFPTASNAGGTTSGTSRQVISSPSGRRCRFVDNTSASSGSSVSIANGFAGAVFWSAMGVELLPNAAAPAGVSNSLMMLGCGT